MFINPTRLSAIILASMFLGMGVAFYIQYVASGLAVLLPTITIVAMVLVIAFLLVLQVFENRKQRKIKKEEETK